MTLNYSELYAMIRKSLNKKAVSLYTHGFNLYR